MVEFKPDVSERLVWEFLEHWISVRTGQIKKFNQRALRHKREKQPGWEFLYEGARRSQQHYENELFCLEELQQAFDRP